MGQIRKFFNIILNKENQIKNGCEKLVIFTRLIIQLKGGVGAFYLTILAIWMPCRTKITAKKDHLMMQMHIRITLKKLL